MTITNTITRQCNDGARTLSVNEAVAAGAGPLIDEAIPQSQTNLAIAFAFVKTKLQSFFMTCDKAITVYTNAGSSGSPQETLVLLAGQAIQWTKADADAGFIACPFAGNVTGLYVTTGAVGTAQLQIRTVVDPT